jgi:hypothetical protein
VRAAKDAAAALRRHGGDADDGAGPLLHHRRQRRLAHVERAAQVDVGDGLVIGGRDIEGLDRLGDAGVVHQNVDPAIFFDSRGDGGVAGGLVGDVAGEPQMVGADRGGGLARRFGVQVEDHDFRAVGGEQSCRGEAQTAFGSRTGDDTDFI